MGTQDIKVTARKKGRYDLERNDHGNPKTSKRRRTQTTWPILDEPIKMRLTTCRRSYFGGSSRS